jgi:hypothetical protein
MVPVHESVKKFWNNSRTIDFTVKRDKAEKGASK